MPGIRVYVRSLCLGGLLAVCSIAFHSTDLAARRHDWAAPTVSITAPAMGASVTGTVTVTASAADNVAIASVQFTLDGGTLGAADTAAPYSMTWNTANSAIGTHTLTAVARDTSGNSTTSAAVSVIV